MNETIVKHADSDYLLMQRDSRKYFGGMWEATADSSALTGEDPVACVIRKLREETGIHSNALREIMLVINPEIYTNYVESFCVTDCEKTSNALIPFS